MWERDAIEEMAGTKKADMSRLLFYLDFISSYNFLALAERICKRRC